MPVLESDSINSKSSLCQFDPKGIYDLTVGFADQCRTALEIGRTTALPTLSPAVRRIHLTGLGGSAAGGDFVKAIFDGEGKASFTVNRDYQLPAYLGPHDLVFCASYSGSTEETLGAYESAKAHQAQIICISSGGELTKRANADGFAVIQVPGGQPPRTAMGFMMVPVLAACERLGLVKAQDWDSCLKSLDEGAKAWGVEVQTDQNSAKQIALSLHGKLPILYGVGPAAAIVANRWKCQINENGKLLAFANGYPELNHNEILGWIGAKEQTGTFHGVRLSLGHDSTKMDARASITERLIGPECPFDSVQPLASAGDSRLAQMLCLAHLGDFVSLYLARLAKVDPEVIPSINFLKEELSKIS